MQLVRQYRLIQDDRLLLFNGEKALGLFAFQQDTLCAIDLRAAQPEVTKRMTDELKASTQRHGEMPLHNTMVAR